MKRMRLLLTSGGLRNQTLIDAFLELAGVPASEIKVAFIPTAQNVKSGDKSWVIDQLFRLREIGVGQIDIVDIAAVGKDVWLPRLEESNVIFVNGGDTTYLMNCLNESGLSEEISRLLQNRLYVGVSAGSYVATPDTRFNKDNADILLKGLGLVDYGLIVHMNNPKLESTHNEDAVTESAKGCPYVVYALDDQMAVRVNDQDTQIIGEGKYIKFDPS